MSNYLISGSEGFIGRHLANRLLDVGHVVYGFSRSPRSQNQRKNYHYKQVDVTDRAALSTEMSRIEVDTVIHLAALTSHEDLVNRKYDALEINMQGTLNILQEFKRSSASGFLYASTGKVYGEIEKLPISESHSTNPLNVLGKSKFIAEQLMNFFCYEEELTFVICRIFNVYGPGQSANFLIPTILRQVLGGATEVVLGNLKDSRDYIFIDDLVEALIFLSQTKLNRGMHIFNVGSGTPHSVSAITSKIGEILGNSIRVVSDKSRFRSDEWEAEYADISKIREEGWSPKYDLEAGLKKSIESFRENRWIP